MDLAIAERRACKLRSWWFAFCSHRYVEWKGVVEWTAEVNGRSRSLHGIGVLWMNWFKGWEIEFDRHCVISHGIDIRTYYFLLNAMTRDICSKSLGLPLFDVL